MEDCSSFAKALLAAIPNRLRDHVEATHQAFLQSQVMLQQYSRALESEPLPSFQLSVVAFGSFGRLDGSSSLSDYDILYIHEGATDQLKVTECRRAITNIVKFNKNMIFDHRTAIEDGSFDFDSSPAYPVVAASDLENASTTNETRVVQLLTEGRVIIGTDEVRSLRAQLLTQRGFHANVHALDLAPMRASLIKMKDDYCRSVIGTLASDKRKLSNRKVMKLFALREFSFIANMFALADISIAVGEGIYTAELAAKILSAPSVNKISAFANPMGSFGSVVTSLPSVVRDAITASVTRSNSNIKLQSATDTGDSELFAQLRIQVVWLVSKYDALLQLLHDKNFVALIDSTDPTVTNWLGLRHFQRLINLRADLIRAAQGFASLLISILADIQGGRHLPALDEAAIALGLIAQYQLTLRSPV